MTSGMERIWSAVRELLNSLRSSLGSASSKSNSGAKGLRDRLDKRVEVERQKKEDLEEIEDQIKGLRSAIGSLWGGLGQLQRRLSQSRAEQSKILEQQKELDEQMRRLKAALVHSRSDLEQIEEIKKIEDMRVY